MAKARNYPGADRSRFVGDKFDGRIFTDLDKLLLHSTETTGLPGYSGGAEAPTLTVNPWPGQRKVWQHFDLNESARALLNPSSTSVSENKDNVCQIEVIGYSDKAKAASIGRLDRYLPNLDADSRQWLANVFAFIMREWTIPNVWAEPFPWPLYPASYGLRTPSRMTSAEYDRFAGVLGHLHASGNNHGDPSLPVVDLKARVGLILNPPKPPTVTPTPPPSTSTTEGPSMFLVKIKGTDPLYKSDGFRRVHVTREERDALLAGGVKIVEVKDAKGLAGYGPEVSA